MTTFEKLLENYWFVKELNPENYNMVKQDLTTGTQDFIKNKLGYKLIVNPYLIKLEKIPQEERLFMLAWVMYLIIKILSATFYLKYFPKHLNFYLVCILLKNLLKIYCLKIMIVLDMLMGKLQKIKIMMFL